MTNTPSFNSNEEVFEVESRG
ncbi:hypothetical protein CCACVL1_23647 [Corchorus capsularis]|uniref:Uncharacterized protein n=1 Tax=Corchorus capsularis TaxID=210143 RepID=A0A1R3GT06_COCAP|nr:hypothetical protein CCACVL1_23647 [Corchorus capsularis]